jgi:hypothetical protein
MILAAIPPDTLAQAAALGLLLPLWWRCMRAIERVA